MDRKMNRKELLVQGIDQIGLDVSNEKIDLLMAYIKELEAWNAVHNLIRAEGDDIVTKHILDSLAGVKIIEKYNFSTLADIGSGGGLPGIPLAICFDEVQVSLVEKITKKCGFLENAAIELGLKNLEVINSQVEAVKSRFDILTFRAFSPLEKKLMKTLRKVLAPEGKIIAYKGRLETIDMEIKQAGLKPNEVEIITMNVPGLDDQRHMVVI